MTPLPPRPSVDFIIAQANGRPSEVYARFLLQLMQALNDRFSIASSSVAPTINDIPDGQFRIWKNTTDSTVKLYANDGGALVETTLT